MPGDTVQLIDDPFGTPSTVIDLNNESPYGVERFSAPPADLNEDRQLELDLELITTTQDLAATAAQNLGRAFNRLGGVWLKHQQVGKTNPLYYRLNRISIPEWQDMIAAQAYRKLRLQLGADPRALGAPETNTATIRNDPTTGTNKMQFTMPTVKGDVATPLHLSWPTPTDLEHRARYASYSSIDGTTLTAPYYQSLTSPTKKADGGGFTIVDAADTSNVSGNKRTITGTGFIVPTSAVVLPWTSLPVGDYRVMVRTNGADAGTELLFFNQPPINGVAYTADEAALTKPITVSSTGRDWHDLGVASMPGGAPPTDNAYGLDPAATTALWNVGVNLVGAIDLDAVVLIPAGRPDVVTSHGMIELPTRWTSKDAYVDGVNLRRYGIGESVHTSGTNSRHAPQNVSGGYPLVIPGQDNVITLFVTVSNDKASRVSDSKTTDTVVTWKYFPAYTSERPATT